ncbi:PREDICTED: alpha-galactosidase-like [Amphimedon queenslandica]|uniref:Alpha-galactosidase n=1 Tax=Amphimedon queenslandica TaxID=400682 RepID=A0A1X7VE87_AMPQE|nr:PREDICTED: alpha-galactosidase-like [Amphimedon queenslandica]|eukprot:XP_011402528.1 PREDICTED: alpha-galactosidase-like [Amphimedon queenslandica]
MLSNLLFVVFAVTGAVFANNNGVGLKPPMGWDMWCTNGRCERDYCDAKEVMDVTDAMVTNGMKDAGYEYVIISDCWADHRDENGNIVPDKDRFPDGLVPVIQHINSKGFKAGLYTDAGMYTCSPGGRNHTIPGSYGHYEQDANAYASWGVEYVKVDWCSTKVNGTQLDPHKQYQEMSEALNKTGKPIFLNSCEWGIDKPWEWMHQYANSWRTGPDHHDDWKTTSKIIELNADLGDYAGVGKGWNDPDFIMTGGQSCNTVDSSHCPGMTDTEYRTEFTLWCLMSAPLLVVTDVRNMTSIMKEVLLNKDLIEINQDTTGPGGKRIGFDKTCGENVCQIWAKNITNGEKAIALYNADSVSHNITLEFSLLGWKMVNIRNLWDGTKYYNFTESVTVVVESHGVQAYRASAVQ